MSKQIIDIRGLECSFGSTHVLRNLDLQVSPGTVYALVGENGCGKTTLIRHMLGRRYPDKGSVTMFGFNPVAHPKSVLGRIGYLSDSRDMPTWMRVGEFIRYVQAFYPAWDPAYADDLQEMFSLHPDTHISELSRGQAARLGLLCAAAHRPELLLLDEPSSGLDPVVRRDIVEEILCTVAKDGRTAFFSSHLLDEVQKVADCVGIMRDGRIWIEESVDTLLRRYLRIAVQFVPNVAEFPLRKSVRSYSRDGSAWTVVVSSEEIGTIRHQIHRLGGEVVEESAPSLEQLFVSLFAEPAVQ